MIEMEVTRVTERIACDEGVADDDDDHTVRPQPGLRDDDDSI